MKYSKQSLSPHRAKSKSGIQSRLHKQSTAVRIILNNLASFNNCESGRVVKALCLGQSVSLWRDDRISKTAMGIARVGSIPTARIALIFCQFFFSSSSARFILK